MQLIRISLPSARRVLVVAALLIACACGLDMSLVAGRSPVVIQAGSQKPQGSSAARGSQSSKPAATKELALIDLEGYRKLLADHRGKPLLVTFWATWCEPCRDEYPLVNQIARQYAPLGLVVIGVDMDDDAELTLVRRFLERNQPIFPNVRKKMGHEDAFVDGVDPRWKDVMPANFFYAADGRLAGFMTGGRPREDFEKMIRAILPSSANGNTHP